MDDDVFFDERALTLVGQVEKSLVRLDLPWQAEIVSRHCRWSPGGGCRSVVTGRARPRCGDLDGAALAARSPGFRVGGWI
jgi:hypothetical protein